MVSMKRSASPHDSLHVSVDSASKRRRSMSVVDLTNAERNPSPMPQEDSEAATTNTFFRTIGDQDIQPNGTSPVDLQQVPQDVAACPLY